MRYSDQPIDDGFLSFAKNMVKNIGKKTSKNVNQLQLRITKNFL